MKKILIIILIFFLNASVFAADSESLKLTKIENHIFGYDYSNKPKDFRLTRIEKEVYGIEKKGGFNTRLSKIAKDLCLDVLDEKNDLASAEYIDESEIYSDDSVDYPVIDKIEQSLNIKSNKKTDLNSRLALIENNVFKKVNTSDDFYTRLEKIKNKLGTNFIDNYYSNYSDEFDFNDNQEHFMDDLENSKFNNPFNIYKLSVLEQKILNDTYPYDNKDRRLARLENYIFSTDFSEDNDKIRISRLEEAIKSMNHQKHDGSKLQKTINTAMQIATMVLMVLAIIL